MEDVVPETGSCMHSRYLMNKSPEQQKLCNINRSCDSKTILVLNSCTELACSTIPCSTNAFVFNKFRRPIADAIISSDPCNRCC